MYVILCVMFVSSQAHGHTALHMAAGLHGNPYQEELIQLLLKHGADPSIRNLENDQPAHLLQSGDKGERVSSLALLGSIQKDLSIVPYKQLSLSFLTK